jgi:colanic acid biosynthesis glycosyl transferase WcaI
LKQGVWLQKLGHEITFITSMPYYPVGRIHKGYRWRLIIKEKIEGLNVIRIWSIPAPNRGLFRRIASQISFAAGALVAGLFMSRHDLVIASIPNMATETACLIIGRLKRSKVLLELRDLIPANLALVGVKKESLSVRLLSKYFNLVYRWVDLIAVTNENTLKALQEKGVSPSRILMLPHAVDPEQLIAADGHKIRRRLNLEGKFIVVYAGSFGSYYDVPNMVSSAYLLNNHLPDIHLLLVGTGHDIEKIRDMINKRGGERITLVDPVPPKEVGAYLQAGDLFIASLVSATTPRHYQDCITTKICEYLMAGKPIIAVENAPVLGAFLQKIDAGFSVPSNQPKALADAIVFFATNPEERMRCGKHACQFAEANLTRRKIVEKFEGELVQKLRDIESQNNKNEHDYEVSTYFNRAATTFDTFYDHKRSKFMQWIDRKYRSDIFKRYYLTFETIKSLKDKTVLDIGCGTGPYVVEATLRGCRRAVGLDMAQAMLDLGRQRANASGVADKCEFILGTFPQDSPQETFDYAIVMGVMDYIADPSTLLSALAQRVRLCAVLSFPSKHWFRTSLRKIRYWLKRCPVYFYEPLQIEKLSKSAGFSNAKIEKIPGAGMDYFVILFK